MATLNVTNTFTNGTVADALQVNQNFTDVKSFVESNVVHVDGSVKAGVGALDFALTGIVVPYVGAAAPTGWLFCRGQLVSKATYAALYAAVGPNAFGTDTATDFYLPNLQGRVPVGVSTTDTDFDRADVGGVKSVTLTANQSGLVGHNHTQNEHTHASPAHTHANQVTVTSSSGAHNNIDSYVAAGTNGAPTNPDVESITPTAVTINGATATNNAVASASAIEAHTNLQPYIALNFIVKT